MFDDAKLQHYIDICKYLKQKKIKKYIKRFLTLFIWCIQELVVLLWCEIKDTKKEQHPFGCCSYFFLFSTNWLF